MKDNNLWSLETRLMRVFFLFRVELFSKYTKVASKICYTMLPGDSWEWLKYVSYQPENCRK